MAEKKPGRQLGPTGETVRANIRAIRDKQRISGAELSARLGEINRPIPPLGIQRIEAGSRRVDVDDLAAIAVALGVSPASLLMPPTDSVDDAVSITGSPEAISAGRAWAWIGGAFPLHADDEFVEFVKAAWPAWRLYEFVTAGQRALIEHQRMHTDPADGTTHYGEVTFGTIELESDHGDDQ